MRMLFLLIGTLLMASSSHAEYQQKGEGKHFNYRYVKYFEYGNYLSKADTGKVGSIEGKVIYKGNRALKNKRKLITKDKEVCGRGYKIDKVYEISEAGGVKNAVLFIETGINSEQTTSKLLQRRCEFNPRVIAMSAGSTLEIINKDAVKHEANGVQDFETIFQLSQPKQGLVDTVKLEKAGIVEVTCNIHGWMKAWVVVTKGNLHAVTDKNGQFRISGIPAGKHKLRLWHEGFGEKSLQVNVEAGKTTKVTIEID